MGSVVGVMDRLTGVWALPPARHVQRVDDELGAEVIAISISYTGPWPPADCMWSPRELPRLPELHAGARGGRRGADGSRPSSVSGPALGSGARAELVDEDISRR